MAGLKLVRFHLISRQFLLPSSRSGLPIGPPSGLGSSHFLPGFRRRLPKGFPSYLRCSRLLPNFRRRAPKGFPSSIGSLTSSHTSEEYYPRDIVEECFVRLLQRGFPEGGRITSYIHASVRNQAIDYLRKNKSVRILPEDEEGLISDEEAFGASCEESRIWEALERLPLRRRQIFIMSRRDGMSHEEIAKELAISVRTVKNQISRALAAFDRKKFTKILTFFF